MSIGKRQPESSGVGEQESYRYDDTSQLLNHHKNRVVARRFASGFGELPETNRVERTPSNVVLNPNLGPVPDWYNQFTQSNFPFTTDGNSQRILPANPLRTYLLIQNKSADFIYVNFGQNATVYNGIRVAAGGYYELIGGAGNGAPHVPGDDVFILGAVAGLDGVASEGVYINLVE